jgi:hypothetical protein
MSVSLNLAHLELGARLALADGRVVEIVDNPRDGSWVVCREDGDGDDEFLVGPQDITALA